MSPDTVKILFIVDMFLLLLSCGVGFNAQYRTWGWGAGGVLAFIALLLLGLRVFG